MYVIKEMIAAYNIFLKINYLVSYNNINNFRIETKVFGNMVYEIL